MDQDKQSRPCEKMLVAFVVEGTSRNRIEIPCDSKDCLSLRIWGDNDHIGAGINRVAKSEIARLNIDGDFDGAYLEGNCRERHA